MRDTLGESLKKLRWIKIRKNRMSAVLLILSLVVSFHVFWALRQPGLTLAGDASCGISEHRHDELCSQQEVPCELEEHTHSITCYADETADVESQLDWQEMFADYPFTGELGKDLAGIAQTQVGYHESELNFEVGSDGIRRGYTRYGAWYGAPYSDWSAMFVSFCLHYAGADPAENPGNTGAASMAKLWEALEKYAAAGEYTPCIGDLVFFTDSTVGVIAEVQPATIYVIRGDVDGAVSGDVIPVADETILGWGLTEGTLSAEETVIEPVEIQGGENDIHDLSKGPVFRIYIEDNEAQQTRRFTLKNTRTTGTDLLDYLADREGSYYFFTLLDPITKQELSKDPVTGHYIATSGRGYDLSITFYNSQGYKPGTYVYQTPDGLQVNGGSGEFILNDTTNVGTYTVSDDGLIVIEFNDKINNRSKITITAELGIRFPADSGPIDFDGQIKVTVQPPPETPTELSKWGIQGDPENATKPGANDSEKRKIDPTKIYWNVSIVGKSGSYIPGSVITDNVVSGADMGTHRYTDSDMAEGLRFGASSPDGQWHGWIVRPGDPNLQWDENGWSYEIPQSVKCDYCGQITLGNDGWIYYIDYTSTPDASVNAGKLYYMNYITVDGKDYWGGADFTHGEVLGSITKNGSFVANGANGAFLWELQAMVPGKQPDKKADYYWYIMDYMYILNDDWDNIGDAHNDADLSVVTANYNDSTIYVPKVEDATVDDPFAWHNEWSPNRNGVTYGREIALLCRCHCTEENCMLWNGTSCGSQYWLDYYTKSDYCRCWTEEKNTTFTFSYKTDDASVLEDYGGISYRLQNIAELWHKPNGGNTGILVAGEDAIVTIPGVFKKELDKYFDGYTAHYEITVNEGKLPLTNGEPLNIRDEMSQTLAFISGSLVITAEDANGNITTLKQGTDYTVSYNGTGEQTDANGNPVHVLEIRLLRPQPVMYILDYDATLIMPDTVTSGIKYSNSATVTLWGENITTDSEEAVYANFNISAHTYRVEMYKTAKETGAPLAGATFGLYNAKGGLITSAVTDENGRLFFETNVTNGIVLRDHELYYMQELDAPDGYRLDDTKYWFCFCDTPGADCDVCHTLTAETGAFRIPFDEIGSVYAENELLSYDLPATGGPGIYPFVLVGVTLIITPLVYGSIRRRKQERRGAD